MHPEYFDHVAESFFTAVPTKASRAESTGDDQRGA
jgi:hypothetical protein